MKGFKNHEKNIMENLVFVYGTLKKDFPNNMFYLNTSKYIGDYKTVEHYPLIVSGDRYSPWLLDEAGKGFQVKGELYSVSDTVLKLLDVLELTSDIDNGFHRKEIFIETINGKSIHRVYAYTYLRYRNQIIKQHTDYLDDYQDRRWISVMNHEKSKIEAAYNKVPIKELQAEDILEKI